MFLKYLICITILSLLIPLCNKKPLLVVFACIMCSTVFVHDIFLFFIGIELLGILSALFVSVEKQSKPALTVYAYNIFASLLFLYGILNQNTELGAWCILIACLCKSAQFPFSNWLLQATHAHTFVSIFIHCATIVGLGIICLYKFPEVFIPYPRMCSATVVSGLVSAVVFSAMALFETDIKKIMAMLTISSAGIMYVLCGLKHTDIAILYFICHAFYKSTIFLIFHYFIQYYKTKDFRKFKNNHGVKLLGTFVLSSALGIPPFIGSYTKIAIGNIEIPLSCKMGVALSILLSDTTLIRLYLKCFRTTNTGEKFNFIPVWWLLIMSLPIGYVAFTNIHGIFSWQTITEEAGIAIVALAIAYRLPVKQLDIKTPHISFVWLVNIINYVNKWIERMYIALAYKNIYRMGMYLTALHRNSFKTHVRWIFCGFIIIILYIACHD